MADFRGYASRYARALAIGCVVLSLQACQSAPTGLSGEEQTLLAKGDAARSLKRYGEAKTHYTQAAALSTGAVRAHLELAGLHVRANDTGKARKVLEQAHALNPGSVEVSKEYARILLQANEPRSAARIAGEALEYAPGDVRLLNLRGVSLDRLGRHGEAQAAYAQALRHAHTREDREVSANNHALSLVASGRYDAAIATILTHVPDAESSLETRQLLALAYGVKGDEDKARELGLRDLGTHAVEENLRFYRQLRDGTIPASTLFMPAR